MIRSQDGKRLNYLVNHSTIRPTAGGDGKSYLDLAPFVDDEANVFLDGDFGGLFFHWSAPDTYEVHIFVLPEGRGQWAAEFAHWALVWMIGHGAFHLWARVPEKHIELFIRKVGFVERGKREWDFGGGMTEYTIYDWRKPCPQ